MAYIEKKKIKGKNYYYLKESKRVKGKVKTKTLCYLGKTEKIAKAKYKQLQEKKQEKKEKIKEKPIKKQDKYQEILELASRRSLFYPSSEIYASAPAGFWNFGPYGASIRRKIIQLWRKELLQKENMLEIYGSQIMPEDIFKASGHLKSFNDPIVSCKKCNKVYRADELITSITGKAYPEATPIKKLDEIIKKEKIKCPRCNSDLSKVTLFNMMIKTELGVSGKNISYLRPEACQSIFLDFSRMAKTMRLKLPKGIAQVGRAFRNEISPRQSLFREVEFSQFEAEIFFNPGKINEIENFDEVKNYKIRILRLNKDKIEEISTQDLVNKKIVSGKLVAYFLARTQQLYEKYGIPLKKMRFREVGKDERAFYAKETWDFEVLTALGWMELIANNYRQDYDLKGHSKGSKKDLTFIEDGRRFIPHIWEISGGVDRTFYAIIDNAFKKEEIKGRQRIILTLNPKLAPFDTVVFPLIADNKLIKKSQEVINLLRDSDLEVFYDSKDSIGRRYRRTEEVGVSNAITIDFQTLKDNTVTLRDSITTKQIRVKIKDIVKIVKKFLRGERLNKLGKIIN